MLKRITKVVLFAASIAVSNVSFAQHGTSNCYQASDPKDTLPLLFQVEAIVGITVDNNHGPHKLNARQLSYLKQQLRKARYSGGLLLKPNHLIITIKLAPGTGARPGLVYGSTGAINFDGGVGRDGQKFAGTWCLPENLNFENYR